DDGLRQTTARRGSDRSRARRRLDRTADLRHPRSPRSRPCARGRSLPSQRNRTPSVALYGGRARSPNQQEPPMRKLIILAVAAAALTTAACNTIQGVGKDTQAAGQAVEGAARDAKN